MRQREARRAYEEAVKIDPTLVEAYLNLGLLSAIQHGSGEALGYFNLAGVLRQKGDRHGAIAAYTSAIQRQSDLT